MGPWLHPPAFALRWPICKALWEGSAPSTKSWWATWLLPWDPESVYPTASLDQQRTSSLPANRYSVAIYIRKHSIHFYVLSFIPHLVSTLGLWGEPTALGELGLGESASKLSLRLLLC